MRFSSPVAPRSTSIPRMVSVRTSRPACQADMSSEPYTAQGLTAAQRMRGSCNQTSGLTLNVYGHLIKERQAKAREEDGGILGRVLSQEHSTPMLNGVIAPVSLS